MVPIQQPKLLCSTLFRGDVSYPSPCRRHGRFSLSYQVGNLTGITFNLGLLQHAIHALRNDDQRGWSEKIPTLPEESASNCNIGTVPRIPMQIDFREELGCHGVAKRTSPTDL